MITLPKPSTWQEFEELIADIARQEWGDKVASRYGRSGQPEYGVDIHCRTNADGEDNPARRQHRGVQCKDSDSISIEDIKEEAQDAEEFEPSLDTFVIATTKNRDEALQRRVRNLSEEYEDAGKFSVRIIMWEDICEMVAKHPRVIDAHYPHLAQSVVDIDELGFVKLSATFFASQTASDVRTAWQSGFTLKEIKEGYAFPRHGESGSTEITKRLIMKLLTGDDLVVLGRSAMGKSTVCKSVACQWFEQAYGPVYYRETEELDIPIDDPTPLELHVSQADGIPLVVVEDAVRSRVDGVFDLLMKDTDDRIAAFLFDARTPEWRQFTGDHPTIKDCLTEYPLPDLRPEECDTAIEHFSDLTDSQLECTGEEIFSRIPDKPENKLILLAHEITQAEKAARADGGTTNVSTALDANVRNALESIVAEESESLLKLSIGVSILTAAEIELRREYLAGLVNEEANLTDLIRKLDGLLLFGDPEADVLRGNHQLWGEQFLKQLLEHPVSQVREIFTKCLDDLIPIVALQAKQVDAPSGAPPVYNLFQIGLRNPELAPIYGTGTEGQLDLTDEVSFDLVSCCELWRGEIVMRKSIADGGSPEYNLDTAINHFESLIEIVNQSFDGESVSQHVQAAFRGNIGRCRRLQGNLISSRQALEKSLTIFEELDSDLGIGACHYDLGLIALIQGKWTDARDHYQASLEIARDIDDKLAEANCLDKLGLIARRQDLFDEAQELYQQSLKLQRDLGDDQGAIASLVNLQKVAKSQGHIEVANEYHTESQRLLDKLDQEPQTPEPSIGDYIKDIPVPRIVQEFYRQSFELELESRFDEQSTQITEPRGEALRNLANVTLSNGDLEKAVSYYQQSLSEFEKAGEKASQADVLIELAELTHELDRFEESEQYFERSIEAARESGNQRKKAMILHRHAQLVGETGRTSEAKELIEESVQIMRDVDDRHGEAEVLTTAASIFAQDEQYDRAARYLNRAYPIFNELGDDQLVAKVQQDRGFIAYEQDNLTEAIDYLEASLEIFENLDDQSEQARLSAILGRFHWEENDPEEALKYHADAVNYHLELEQFDDVLANLRSLIIIYINNNMYEDAVSNLEFGLDLIHQSDIREPNEDFIELVIEISEYIPADSIEPLYRVLLVSIVRDNPQLVISLSEALWKRVGDFDIDSQAHSIVIGASLILFAHIEPHGPMNLETVDTDNVRAAIEANQDSIPANLRPLYRYLFSEADINPDNLLEEVEKSRDLSIHEFEKIAVVWLLRALGS